MVERAGVNRQAPRCPSPGLPDDETQQHRAQLVPDEFRQQPEIRQFHFAEPAAVEFREAGRWPPTDRTQISTAGSWTVVAISASDHARRSPHSQGSPTALYKKR